MRFIEMYSHSQAGLKTKKRLRVNAPTTGYVDLDGVWTYDNQGRITSVSYPLNGGTYNSYYDSLGRPNRLAQGGADLVSGVTYGPAGELTAMNWGNATYSLHETRTYNNRLQLTRQTAQALVGSNWVTDVDLEYRFSPTQNNGQITQFKDWMTGEEVSYAYDSLSRLISASTTGPEWGQSYEYDGFGNRTSVTVTKGTAPAGNLTYDQMTNRITNTGFGYDANGNLTAMPGVAITYDVANRIIARSPGTGYAYDADNRRIWKSGPQEVYYYGVDGRRLGTYRISGAYPLVVETVSTNLYFAGRLINSGGKWVATDRLGSVVKSESERLRYFPWGEEQVTSTQNRDKFGTYFRDTSGIDYADQRYYSSSHGRFLTPDPSSSRAAAPKAPQTWNLYSYALADPVNRLDPTGLSAWFCEAQFSYEQCAHSLWLGLTAEGGDDSIRTGGADPCATRDPDGNFIADRPAYCFLPPPPPVVVEPPAPKPKAPEPQVVPSQLLLTEDCYDQNEFLAGNAATRRREYQVMGSDGVVFSLPAHPSGLTVREQNNVQEGNPVTGGVWSYPGGALGPDARFFDLISAGRDARMRQIQTFTATYENMQYRLTVLEPTNPYGQEYAELGIFATPQYVRINHIANVKSCQR